MKFDYSIVHPVEKIDEGEAIHRPTLIAYSRQPISSEYMDRGNGQGEEIVTKYKTKVYINLYLIELRIIF